MWNDCKMLVKSRGATDGIFKKAYEKFQIRLAGNWRAPDMLFTSNEVIGALYLLAKTLFFGSGSMCLCGQ